MKFIVFNFQSSTIGGKRKYVSCYFFKSVKKCIWNIFYANTEHMDKCPDCLNGNDDPAEHCRH